MPPRYESNKLFELLARNDTRREKPKTMPSGRQASRNTTNKKSRSYSSSESPKRATTNLAFDAHLHSCRREKEGRRRLSATTATPGVAGRRFFKYLRTVIARLRNAIVTHKAPLRVVFGPSPTLALQVVEDIPNIA